MPGDGGEDAALRHDVAERGEVAVVDVDAVGVEDEADLLDEAEPGGLDAEHVEDFGG